jgi:hypothetical protein
MSINISNGIDGPASKPLFDSQKLINDSMQDLDSELREINHKVRQFPIESLMGLTSISRFTVILNWVMKNSRCAITFSLKHPQI